MTTFKKFAPGDDARIGVNKVVAELRHLTLNGWGVLAISATKRDKNGKHDSRSLDLSAFRESGDIEYNADSAYVMKDKGSLENKKWLRHIELAHVKNRHGALKSYELEFHMPRMEFSSFKQRDETFVLNTSNPFEEANK